MFLFRADAYPPLGLARFHAPLALEELKDGHDLILGEFVSKGRHLGVIRNIASVLDDLD
jgi:hypothetical protein